MYTHTKLYASITYVFVLSIIHCFCVVCVTTWKGVPSGLVSCSTKNTSPMHLS